MIETARRESEKTGLFRPSDDLRFWALVDPGRDRVAVYDAKPAARPWNALPS